MEIKISLDKIQNGIMQLTAILGRNRQDMKIAVTKDNLPVIGIYIGEAVTEAEDELRRHLSSSNSFTLYKDESSVTIGIKDSVRNAKSIINSITGTLELYLIHYSISRWIGTIESLSNLSSSYQNSAAGCLSKILNLVTQKDAYIIDDESYNTRESDKRMLVSDEYNYKQRAESDRKMSVSDEYNYRQRTESDKRMLVSDEYNYKQRETDKTSTDCNSNFFDNEEYFIRKRDLDPTGRTNGEWPKNVLSTKDNEIAIDKENNILISQPENIDYNENQD